MGDDAPLWGAAALAEEMTTPCLKSSTPDIVRGRIRHALCSTFDGTLSLIREGWQDVMIPMMVELLLETPGHEDEADVEAVVKEYVARLTGKQTIYQMIQLAEEIRKRGGEPARAAGIQVHVPRPA